jgi:uncharacterized protein (TIGR02145 family)
MLLQLGKNTVVIILLALMGAVTVTSCKKEDVAERLVGRGGADVNDSDYAAITIGGKEYTTVKIGTQTWTEMNYDGETGIKPSQAKPSYGKYYTFSQVKAVELPEGWRIPSENDYYKLLSSQSIEIQNGKVVNPEAVKRLTSTDYWLHTPGNNKSGFNAQPAGYVIDSQLAAPGILAEFWTANGTTISIQENINPGELRLLYYAGDNSNTNKFTVRFVKDN